MDIVKLNEEAINRFFELKEKTFPACNAAEKQEYQNLKGLIQQHRPELLAPATPANSAPAPVVASTKGKDNGLSKEENKILKDMNSRFAKLTADEKRQREILRNKIRDFKIKQVRTELADDGIELGETLEELVWIVSIISKGLAPQLFKDASAAALDMSEIKLMHRKANLLNEKING